MPTEKNIAHGIFGAAEDQYQERFRRWRDSLLAPILGGLGRAGIRPWMVTAAGVLASGLAVLFYRAPLVALSMLVLQLVLDGIDGPLSRHRGETSRAGELLDVVADHLSLAAALAVAALGAFLSWSLAFFYLLAYSFLIAFAYARNLIGRPFLLILRPRIALYIAYLLDALKAAPGATQLVGVVSLPLLAGQATLGLTALLDGLKSGQWGAGNRQ
jgi:phosphatidylglycerophosphate synthase